MTKEVADDVAGPRSGAAERRAVGTPFSRLMRSELHTFPARGRVLGPNARGVYVIYNTR